MSRHTPRPWHRDADGAFRAPDNPVVTASLGASGAPIIHASDADAHLIAAAPDMLEAIDRALVLLDNYREFVPEDDLFDDTAAALRAAAARARGEEVKP